MRCFHLQLIIQRVGDVFREVIQEWQQFAKFLKNGWMSVK